MLWGSGLSGVWGERLVVEVGAGGLGIDGFWGSGLGVLDWRRCSTRICEGIFRLVLEV